jgi:hypothetical protein
MHAGVLSSLHMRAQVILRFPLLIVLAHSNYRVMNVLYCTVLYPLSAALHHQQLQAGATTNHQALRHSRYCTITYTSYNTVYMNVAHTASHTVKGPVTHLLRLLQ